MSTAKRYWSNMGSMSTFCPLDCDFCYRKGASPDTIIKSRKKQRTSHDVKKLCRDIFENGLSFDFFEDVGEYFSNSKFLDILSEFRLYSPDETIDFTTSAITLTEEKIKKLSKYNPLFLQVSINSANPETRKKIMKDPKPEIAIDSIKYFKKYGILFSGNIVGWPTIPKSDIRNTILYLDKYEATSIKINLPSFSRFHPRRLQFEFNFSIWDDLISLIDQIRPSIKTPITYEPFLYKNSAFNPFISGVVQNSPADKIGIRYNDLITKVNDTPIVYREQARKMLIQRNEDDVHRNITVIRGDKRLKFELHDDQKEYPYATDKHLRTGKSFGLFIHQGFDITVLKSIKDEINRSGAKKVLIVGSVMLFDEIDKLREKLFDTYFASVKIDFIKAENLYYGGNIMIGDLLTVSDFVYSIQKYCSENVTPDLVVVPGSSFNNGIDLSGKKVSEISASTGIQVSIIQNERILV